MYVAKLNPSCESEGPPRNFSRRRCVSRVPPFPVYLAPAEKLLGRVLQRRQMSMMLLLHWRRTEAGTKRWKRKDDWRKKVKDKVKGAGQSLNGFNQNTGLRLRRICRGSEYHPLPTCPLKDLPKGDSASLYPCSRRGACPPYCSSSMAPPRKVQADRFPSTEDFVSNCGQCLSSTSDLGGQFVVTDAESVTVFESVTPKWLGRQNDFPARRGVPRAETYPTETYPVWRWALGRGAPRN